jgi:hypothetical protein
MRASPNGGMVKRSKADARNELPASKKKLKILLATEVGFCRMRLPRLELNAHRFFNSEIKQCVWVLAG